MDAHGNEHDGHGAGHAVHLPDPSAWPFVAGIAAFIAGGALIWWTRDRDASVAGLALGFGIALLLISTGGWAYQDGKMRKRAEDGQAPAERAPRFSQVLAFAIPAGQLGAARASGGVLTAVDAADLRDIEGFEDLRLTVSPSEDGPSQVLVETTWKGREGIESYEGTRQTLLDLVNAHDSQVVPGTVQTFDMEVVRDTKDTSFRFGMGAAATVLGGLAIGGFMVGAGLNAFASDTKASAGGGQAPVANPFLVVATDNKFNKATLEAAPNAAVTFTLENKGQAKHNLQFLGAKGGKELVAGATGAILDGGGTEEIKFTTPAPGSYYFECVLHPTLMNGTLTVKEGAPAGGAAPDGGATATAGKTVVATDNKFDVKSLEATSKQDVSFTLQNKGKAKHSLSFYDKAGGKALAPGATGNIIDGGQSDTVKFTAPAAGSYYFQCDVHPTEMSGTFVVK